MGPGTQGSPLYIEDSSGELLRQQSYYEGAINWTFSYMEANLHYAIKNQRGASKIPSDGGILHSKAPSRGLWMPELVLYGIRLLSKQFLGTILDIEVDQSAQKTERINRLLLKI